MTGLPQGWATITIGEASGVGGLSTDGDWIESKDQDPTGSVRLIQLQDIGDGTFVNKSSRFLTEEKAEELNCTFLSPGDVLIARMPDPLGRACRFPDIGQKSVTAVDVHVWRKGEHGVEPDFLVYCVNSPEIRQSLQAQASGTTRQRVSGGRLKAQEIPLPPLPEQRRIVRKLDTLSARSTTARTHLTAIEKLVERYKRAVAQQLIHAQEWETVPFLDACDAYQPRTISKSELVPDGAYPVYGANGVIGRYDQYNHEDPQLLITCRGATCGTVNVSQPFSWITGNAMVVDGTKGGLSLAFLREYFAKGFDFTTVISGSAQPQITRQSLAQLRMPVVNEDQQREIVHRIETAFAKIDRLAAEATKALKLLGHLDQRILAKAFAGDLVPQDPNDEPAETLLARIREARATAPKGKRRRATTSN